MGLGGFTVNLVEDNAPANPTMPEGSATSAMMATTTFQSAWVSHALHAVITVCL